MTRRLTAVLLIAATLAIAAPAGASNAPMAITGPSPARTLAPAVRVSPPPPPTVAPVYQVVNRVNAERAKVGLPALQIDDRLMLAAQRHSEDQAFHNHMSHTGSDGSNVSTRLDRVGYAWRGWAENVAYGQRDAATVVTAWMNSAGHRANNLSGNTQVGVGLAYSSNGTPYWTMVFATPR